MPRHMSLLPPSHTGPITEWGGGKNRRGRGKTCWALNFGPENHPALGSGASSGGAAAAWMKNESESHFHVGSDGLG